MIYIIFEIIFNMMFVSIVFKSESLSRFAFLANDWVEVVNIMRIVLLRAWWCSVLCDRPDHRMIYRVGSLCAEVVVYLPLIVSRFCWEYRGKRDLIQMSRCFWGCEIWWWWLDIWRIDEIAVLFFPKDRVGVWDHNRDRSGRAIHWYNVRMFAEQILSHIIHGEGLIFSFRRHQKL